MNRARLILTITMMLFIAQAAYASDVDVYNVSLQNVDTTGNTVDIKFDLAQDNVMTPGTDANAADFYDRVWIFAKYSTDSGATWNHATFTTGGSITTYASGVGISADGMGAFCEPGTNQTVRWAYGTDSVADNATAQIRLFAIEMVLIPAGDFYAGDNVGGSGGSTDTILDKDNNYPALISITGNVIYSADIHYDDAQFGNSGDGIWVDGDGGISKTAATETNMNANFPTGYGAFYIMKYEVSQGQYAAFLNTLTQAQQNTRTADTLTSEDAAGHFVMVGENITALTSLQGIKAGSDPADGEPYNFGVDGEGTPDGTLNESNDGQWRACNYLSWMDLAAYADWAGLRPITELEFEKACRGGGVSAVAGELAWGSASGATSYSALYHSGEADEQPSIDAGSSVNIASNLNYDACSPDGPIRCGAFSTSSTTRTQAGASYYGVMELSGNVWERPVTVGNETGRSFEGTHGNGSLTSDGFADNSDWPGYVTSKVSSATGSTSNGGNWNNDTSLAHVSYRYSAADTARSNNKGGRCARTEP